MKKLLKMAFIAVAILVVSCGKSEDSSINAKDLVGTWYLESMSDGKDSVPLDDCLKRTNVVFTDTQITFTLYGGIAGNCQELQKGTESYRISGNRIISGDEAPKVSLSGNKLTVTDTEIINGNSITATMVFVKR
ncbi:hypothetical protein RCZ04_01220 [Capnocytophaga sp. HP1101]